MPLERLSFGGFSGKGCLTPLTNSLHFFSRLRGLDLLEIIVDDQDLSGLLVSLRFLPNLERLCVESKGMSTADSSAVEVNTGYSVSHRNCKKLILKGMSLTPTIAAILGQSLPKMSSLELFELTGLDGNILQAEVMELLFGGVNKTMPLERLSFGGFSGKGCLTSLTNSLHFFSKLTGLRIVEVIMDDRDLSGLLESLRFLPNLQILYVERKGLAPADSSAAEVDTVYSLPHRNCIQLTLKGISLTPTIAAMLSQSLPKMSFLTKLELTGLDGGVVPAEQMERLFDAFSEKLPLLFTLIFSGCLAPLTRSFCSFPNLRHLSLKNLNMDEHDLCGLLESFRFIPNLMLLDLSGNPLGHAVTSIVTHAINWTKLLILCLYGNGSEEDLNSVRQGLRHRGVTVVTKPLPFDL